MGDMKQWLRVQDSVTDEDPVITGLVQAARETAEVYTGRALAKRTFCMVLDAHPYYTDTIQGGGAYPLAGYYSLPKFATTLWNYAQQIKLAFSPVISVESIVSVQPDGTTKTMNQDVDFLLDRISEPARIFPLPGTTWPPDLYVANAVQINFTAGYDPDPTAIDTHTFTGAGQQPTSKIVTGIPQTIIVAIKQLANYWYENRGMSGTVPAQIEQALYSQAVVDWAPTR